MSDCLFIFYCTDNSHFLWWYHNNLWLLLFCLFPLFHSIALKLSAFFSSKCINKIPSFCLFVTFYYVEYQRVFVFLSLSLCFCLYVCVSVFVSPFITLSIREYLYLCFCLCVTFYYVEYERVRKSIGWGACVVSTVIQWGGLKQCLTSFIRT